MEIWLDYSKRTHSAYYKRLGVGKLLKEASIKRRAELFESLVSVKISQHKCGLT